MCLLQNSPNVQTVQLVPVGNHVQDMGAADVSDSTAHGCYHQCVLAVQLYCAA